MIITFSSEVCLQIRDQSNVVQHREITSVGLMWLTKKRMMSCQQQMKREGKEGKSVDVLPDSATRGQRDAVLMRHSGGVCTLRIDSLRSPCTNIDLSFTSPSPSCSSCCSFNTSTSTNGKVFHYGATPPIHTLAHYAQCDTLQQADTMLC